MDYTCEKGAKRNFERWRDQSATEETEEQRLDRLEQEEEEEKNAMVELETKTLDAKREMQIADALDEIRVWNARMERGEGVIEAIGAKERMRDEAREREEREIEEAAKRAFETEAGEKVKRLTEEEEELFGTGVDVPTFTSTVQDKPDPVLPTFTKTVKKKRDLKAALGIKKKSGLV